MAKVKKEKVLKLPKPPKEERTKKEWSEGELVETFHLIRITDELTT
jgi:hypothetical protein